VPKLHLDAGQLGGARVTVVVEVLVVVEVNTSNSGAAGHVPSAFGSRQSTRPSLTRARHRPFVPREQLANGYDLMVGVDAGSAVVEGDAAVVESTSALTGRPLMHVSKCLLHSDNATFSNPAQTPSTLWTHGPADDPRQNSALQSPLPTVVAVDVTVDVTVVVTELVTVVVNVSVAVDVTVEVTVLKPTNWSGHSPLAGKATQSPDSLLKQVPYVA